jgi:acyl transferase domain-containing protein
MSDEQRAVDYLKRALVDLNETRRRLREADERAVEPIAIVGMGCRYPGGVDSPESLWELVSKGTDAISDLPGDRLWDLDAIRGPDRNRADSRYRGGFINAGDFDAEFFGIDEQEAVVMDPQHRLLLETTWEACEDAGIDPTTLRGSGTGVFIGLGVQSYAGLLLGSVVESSEGYVTSGNAGSMASGRIAHTLGLKGPAMTIDTACSSSATALHVACQSLRGRETPMAIAGGVAIMATPWMYIEFTRQSQFQLSADGRCKSFSDSADGASFSEGVGVIVLERLSEARRLKHDVLAVIRGSAVNQDGASNGLTAPNGLAHERVIRQAFVNAEVSPSQVDVVEGHGMGTVLGDPIEVQALLATYGAERDSDRPLWLGSVKSNIGHTQASGTVAGVIKMVMAMRHGVLPKTLHADAPTRHVDWSSGAVSLLTESIPWIKRQEPRRAAVHAFGLSGTNAHIILEESPPVVEAIDARPRSMHAMSVGEETSFPWILSGRGTGGLQRQAACLAEFVERHTDIDVVDVGYTLAVGRPNLNHRAVVFGRDLGQRVQGLREIASGGGVVRGIDGPVSAANDGVVFVLASYGNRLIEVATSLYESSSVFVAEMERIDEILSELVDWSLRDVVKGVGPTLDSPSVADVVDFAVLASLAALWRALGIRPSAFVGHGLGEITAGYLSGALTLSGALQAIRRHGSDESQAIESAATEVPLWSTSSGESVETAGLDGGYWSTLTDSEPDNLIAVISALLAAGSNRFVQFGSHPIISDDLDPEMIVVAAAPSGNDGLRGMFGSLGSLWATGVAVDWTLAFSEIDANLTKLPPYAFDRRRYWVNASLRLRTDDLMEESSSHPNASLQMTTQQIGTDS